MPFKKLVQNGTLLNSARLLHVIETSFEDISQELVDYDTDHGRYVLPKKGPAILLIFQKSRGDLFTTIRKGKAGALEAYRANIGELFSLIVSNNAPAS